MQVLNMSNNFFAGGLPNFGTPEGENNLDVRGNFFSGRPEIRAWGKKVCPIEGQTEKPGDDETVYLTEARNCLSQGMAPVDQQLWVGKFGGGFRACATMVTH
ncbi:unnamed protein product [Closterium sp. Naga37s-1]|nr:unnamed protein product [Closterium sp. Naga37s-1]